MLNKNQSKKWNSWKYTLVLPLLGAFLFFFQIEVVAQEKVNSKEVNKIKNKNINEVTSKNTSDKEIKENKNTNKNINVVITKKMSDEEIESKCENIKKSHNIDLIFSGIKRNLKGEIVSINAYFKDSKGSHGTANILRSKPIKPFIFFSNKNEIGFNTNQDSDELDDKNPLVNIPSISIDDNTQIYIDDVKSDKSEMEKLDPKEIRGIGTTKKGGKQEIRITKRKEAKPKLTIDGGNEGPEDRIFKGKIVFRNELLVVNGKETNRDPRDLYVNLITSIKMLDT